MQRTIFAPCSVLALSTLLAACGGGGGGSASAPPPPPPPETRLALSASNEQGVARTVWRAMAFQGLAADLGGAEPARLTALSALVAQPLRHALSAGPSRPLAATRNEVPCAGGGKIVFIDDDVNGNGRTDAGDRQSIEFQACVSDGESLSGSVSLLVREATQSSPASRVVLDMQILDLVTTLANGDRHGGRGSITMTVSASGAGSNTVLLESARSELFGRVAGADYAHTLTTWRLEQLSLTNRIPLSSTSTASARLASTGFGNLSVDVQTDPNLVQLDDEDFPRGGALRVLGAGGSVLRLVPLSAQQVRIELDANGDGSFERSSTVTWASLDG